MATGVMPNARCRPRWMQTSPVAPASRYSGSRHRRSQRASRAAVMNATSSAKATIGRNIGAMPAMSRRLMAKRSAMPTSTPMPPRLEMTACVAVIEAAR